MNTRTQPPPAMPSVGSPSALTAPQSSPFTLAQLADLAAELRREYALAERARSYGGHSLELHELFLALQRLDNGVFGICTACGQPIPLARLQVMPAAQRCVGCPR